MVYLAVLIVTVNCDAKCFYRLKLIAGIDSDSDSDSALAYRWPVPYTVADISGARYLLR